MKTFLTLAALVIGLSAGAAMACNDPDCPHGGGKPPKISA